MLGGKQERACLKEYTYRKGNITEVIYEANLKEAACACVSVQYNEVKDNSHSVLDLAIGHSFER